MWGAVQVPSKLVSIHMPPCPREKHVSMIIPFGDIGRLYGEIFVFYTEDRESRRKRDIVHFVAGAHSRSGAKSKVAIVKKGPVFYIGIAKHRLKVFI